MRPNGSPCSGARSPIANGDPLPGVAITILNHPEYGQTLSRSDGMYDLAVNGGGVLTVKYEKGGYLKAQRQADVPWQDFIWLPDVALVSFDTQTTAIDLSTPGLQTARGTQQTDADGTRQATLLIPPGTTAQMILPGGGTQSLTGLNIRATEYTVGPNGPQAMPAPLPPNVGYTYCVELTADEAEQAGAVTVQFNQPLPYYVENFLGFPVGSIVPSGYYDRQKAAWVPSPNGRVIKIVSVTGRAGRPGFEFKPRRRSIPLRLPWHHRSRAGGNWPPSIRPIRNSGGFPSPILPPMT